MATKKKKINKKPEVEVRAPEVSPRAQVFICDRPFWADVQKALTVLSLETATTGMGKAEFSAFAKRYRLSLELWTSAEGNTKMVLCEGEHILGDWLD